MLKYEEERPVIENFLNELKKAFPTWKWATDGNSAEIFKEKVLLGTLVIDGNKFQATGKEIEEFLVKLIDKKAEADKNKLTPEKAKKSVFKTIYDSPQIYNGLKDNFAVFEILNKQFEKMGINEVTLKKSITNSTSLSKKLILGFDNPISMDFFKTPETGYYERLRKILFDSYPHDEKEYGNFYCSQNSSFIEPTTDKEEILPIKLQEIEVGKYYKERNLILIHFNPFQVKKVQPLDTEPSKILIELISELKGMKLETVSIDGFEKKMLIGNFLKNSKTRLKSIQSDLIAYEDNITRLSREIRTNVETLNGKKSELIYIEETLSSNGKNMFEELDLVKKLPFLEKVELGVDNIQLKYKPTTITIPDFKRGDHLKSFGKRTFYLGSVGVKISPGHFEITNDNSLSGHSHPHSSGNNGSPCFGGGDADRKVYELLACNKFSEVAKFMWFWIKVYRNEGAYVKMWDSMNDRLTKGFPVWDEKGVRIEINEPERIKSGEQVQLNKAPEYADNIKKFKDMKMF